MKLGLNKNPFTGKIPKILKNIRKDVNIDNKPYTLRLWDSSFKVESLVHLYFPSNVVLLCFALNSKKSFNHLISKYIPKISEYRQTKNIILIGTKSDLRQPGNQNHISDFEARQFARQHNFSTYISCSTKNNIGLNKIFPSCIRLISHCEYLSTNSSFDLTFFGIYFHFSLLTCVPLIFHSAFILVNNEIKSNFQEINLYKLTIFIEAISIIILFINIFFFIFPIDKISLEEVYIKGIHMNGVLNIIQMGIGITLIILANASDVGNDKYLYKKFQGLGIDALAISLIHGIIFSFLIIINTVIYIIQFLRIEAAI